MYHDYVDDDVACWGQCRSEKKMMSQNIFNEKSKKKKRGCKNAIFRPPEHDFHKNTFPMPSSRACEVSIGVHCVHTISARVLCMYMIFPARVRDVPSCSLRVRDVHSLSRVTIGNHLCVRGEEVARANTPVHADGPTNRPTGTCGTTKANRRKAKAKGGKSFVCLCNKFRLQFERHFSRSK